MVKLKNLAPTVLSLAIFSGCTFDGGGGGGYYNSRSSFVPGHGWVDSENEDISAIRQETQRKMDKDEAFQRRRAQEYEDARRSYQRNVGGPRRNR